VNDEEHPDARSGEGDDAASADEAEAPRAARLSPRVRRAGAAIAVAALLIWVIWRAWHDARRIDWQALDLRPGLIVLSCVLLGVAFVWHALVWVALMRAMGYSLRWLPGTRAAVLSQLGSYIPGKVFIFVFRVEVAARHGVPRVPVAASVALETLLRTLMAVLVSGLGLYAAGAGTLQLRALVLVGAISLIFAHPRIFHGIGDWVLRRLGHDPVPSRVTSLQVLGLLLGYLIFWGLYVAGFYLMLEGTLGADPADWPWFATAICLSQIGGAIAVFAPAGLGAAEATLAGVLDLTGAVSAPYMVALVTRVWRTVAELAQIGVVMAIPVPASSAHGDVPDARPPGDDPPDPSAADPHPPPPVPQ